MEFGFWGWGRKHQPWFMVVLILVIMEFGFWDVLVRYKQQINRVLILVIMEFGFWVSKKQWQSLDVECLNPCYNGIWFLSLP